MSIQFLEKWEDDSQEKLTLEIYVHASRRDQNFISYT